MLKQKGKIYRRLGIYLFAKDRKTIKQNIQRVKSKKRKSFLSDYGKQFLDVQRLKYLYNIKDTQFKKYVKDVLKKRGKVENPQELLIRKLEKRLDNVVFRLGLALTRRQARQFVFHGHFLVNGRKVNIPSYEVKLNDKIEIRTSSQKKFIFLNLSENLKDYQPPSWLRLDIKKFEGQIVSEPSLEKIPVPVDISSVFEFYSR